MSMKKIMDGPYKGKSMGPSGQQSMKKMDGQHLAKSDTMGIRGASTSNAKSHDPAPAMNPWGPSTGFKGQGTRSAAKAGRNHPSLGVGINYDHSQDKSNQTK